MKTYIIYMENNPDISNCNIIKVICNIKYNIKLKGNIKYVEF